MLVAPQALVMEEEAALPWPHTGLSSETHSVYCSHPGPAAVSWMWLLAWAPRGKAVWSRSEGKLDGSEKGSEVQLRSECSSDTTEAGGGKLRLVSGYHGEGLELGDQLKGYTLGSFRKCSSHFRLDSIML